MSFDFENVFCIAILDIAKYINRISFSNFNEDQH